ncbi:hypothetical protein [Streptomyces sp. Amel2xC10]|uniref:hypothetical protein n=1 Tax=Streptomyces sp. Amel2xC10 TaxID=1305826 RepID=UPI000A083344|nr:hypothetical protein [Streptomyces sp. Amel2xC10]SMF78963.1 thiazole/oxazole-forming peptide maturase, SagC family component [Streptomyces sp. Amel2xC10]
MTVAPSAPGIVLATSVRLLAVEPGVIRLRWGIWNFSEVTVDLRAESPEVRAAMTEFFDGLATGEAVDGSFTWAAGLSPLERTNLRLAVTELRQAGFLAHDSRSEHGIEMARALLGNLDLYGTAESVRATVGLVSDSPSAAVYVTRQTEALGTPVELMPAEFMTELAEADLTSGMGGLTAADTLKRLSSYVEHCDSLIVSVSRASLLTLRNLNRLACHLEKPVVVGLVDGPFATVVGAESPRTGCLECFEQRSLARLEDHIGYHAFVGTGTPRAQSGPNGVEWLLCAHLVNEAVLLHSLGTSRFLGRALSIYLPTYEMQAQDVLRIGTCPACGHVARDIVEEINFSSRVVIDQHVRNALGGSR